MYCDALAGGALSNVSMADYDNCFASVTTSTPSAVVPPVSDVPVALHKLGVRRASRPGCCSFGWPGIYLFFQRSSHLRNGARRSPAGPAPLRRRRRCGGARAVRLRGSIPRRRAHLFLRSLAAPVVPCLLSSPAISMNLGTWGAVGSRPRQ